MRYHDQVYGDFIIAEPVILELINSPALQRLKGVNQGGYGPMLTKPCVRANELGHNRFTHSLGVYLLLHKYKAPLEEQVAGLIHDVSHSVFSHCIDYVSATGNGKEQNHQDNLHDSFIKKTSIPKILKKYGFDLDYILDDKNFPLKETLLPDLCADRIDYILREAVFFKEISKAGASELIENLTVRDKKWVFKNFKSAKKFARLFFKMNKEYYSGLSAARMFLAIGGCVKYALQKKYIKPEDLYTTEKNILIKIKKHLKQDKILNLLWLKMNNKIKAKQVSGNYDGQIFCKSRIVDPLFLNQGKIKRLSETLPGWSKIVKQELKPKQYFLKFEKYSGRKAEGYQSGLMRQS